MQPAVDPLAQLTEIRAIMERSSRFLSLSGLAGVGAGVVALVGAGVAHMALQRELGPTGFAALATGAAPFEARARLLPLLVGLAAVMIAVGLLVAFFFTRRRAALQGVSLWGPAAQRFGLSLLAPLGAGGLFALALYYQGAVGLVVPALLLFYGLALLSASKYTLNEIRGLGYVQVALGLVGLLVPPYGLWLFAAGFGLAHIGYGVLMFNRYERGPRAQAA